MFIPNLDLFSLNQMPLTDKWCLDENKAYFFTFDNDELVEVNFDNKKLALLDQVPDRQEKTIRGVSGSIKIRDDIYAFPDTGKYIWKYNISKKKWKRIDIDNDQDVRLGIYYYWQFNDVVVMYSYGLKCIMYLSILDDRIYQYDKVSDEDDALGKPELVGEDLYIVSTNYPIIYKYKIFDCTVEKIKLDGLKSGMYTISCAGSSFYLSGKSRELYKLCKDKQLINVKLPTDFGAYNFFNQGDWVLDKNIQEYDYVAFQDIIHMKTSTWFIPGVTNKVLYIRDGENTINELYMPEEVEDSRSIKRRSMAQKFNVLYTREDRYIGLYSHKNSNIIEIDTINNKYEVPCYDIRNILGGITSVCVNEEEFFNLCWFVNGVGINNDWFKNMNSGESGNTIGRAIYLKLLN